MAAERWISARVIAASLAVLGPIRAYAQATQASPAAVVVSDLPVDPQLLVDGDIAELRLQLTRPAPIAGGNDEGRIYRQREEAARRLVSRSSARAVRYILDTLQSPATPHDAKLAICRAIAEDPQPDPAYAGNLIPLLGTDRAINDVAAKALARFGGNPAIRERLIAFAQNPAQPLAMRIGAVRAMGGIVSRDMADGLIGLMADPKLQSAAGDALGDLSGLSGNTHDIQRWRQWQAGNANKPDVVWRADTLATRDLRLANGERAQSDFSSELQQILTEQYQVASQKGKDELVLRLLNSPEPHTRQIGIQFVTDAQLASRPYPSQAPKRLEELVGDSDPGVRLLAAQAIKSLNDTDAVDAILAQLPQEANPDVKVAQVSALVAMRRLRALPELRQLLLDPSIKVATAAVDAIRAISANLLVQNPVLATQVAAGLWQIGNQRKAEEPGGGQFFAATLDAVGALRDRSHARELLELLNINNEERIRSAALRALGSIGDRGTSFQIAQWLQNEPSADVRVDAIKALGSTSNFEEAADTLYRYMSPNTEPDKRVREGAWAQFQAMLPTAANLAVLNRWASDFQNDPSHRLLVLLALDDKLQHDMRSEDLAASRQNTGETYLKLGDPSRAAIQFAAALGYWQKQQVANQVTVLLVKQLLEAHLAAREYDKAADFAAKQIAADRSMQTLVGPIFRNSAEGLYDAGVQGNDAQKLRDAASLIDNVFKMQPPLDERYQPDLKQWQTDIRTRLQNTTPK